MRTMTILHEAARRAGWSLRPQEVQSLQAVPAARLLLVLAGRVWATETVRPGAAGPAQDHWLDAGQTLALPAGSSWVVEASGATRLVLLLPPAAALTRGGGLLVGLRRAWHGLRARLAPPSAPRAA